MSLDRASIFDYLHPLSLLNRWRYLSIAVLLSGLTACNSSGSSLQNALAPDPKLKDNPVGFSASSQPSPSSSSSSPSLPKDFPLYPQAKLTSSEQTPDRGIVTNWTSKDAIDKIQAFYQQELPTKQWQILGKPSNADEDLVAEQQQIQVKIGYNPDVKATESGVTNFTITYLDKDATASSSPSPFIAPAANNSPPANAIATNSDYLADLTQLGILNSADNNKNKIVTRREYARWLVAAYNRLHSTKPTQQIRLATTNAKPAFQDVPTNHPDFPSIQGLAEAGLIPSPLSGDATAVLFRPDTPLTREQLILWKVPLDTRQALPTASLDALKQTWGFQDVGKIDPKAMRAILADFQSGDRSNIRRVFGYTTLFQPKKTVTLNEVATTLWYFGSDAEGVSAEEALKNN